MNILNETKWVSRFLSGKDLPTEQSSILQQIISHYYDQSTLSMDYDAFIDSKHWQDMTMISHGLKNYDLKELDTYESQLAFWLNTFNMLTLHGIGKSTHKEPVKEDSAFFSETAYNIGEEIFSLDDIEHGLLRSNSAKYRSSGAFYKNNESQQKWVLNKLDPTVHFSLYSACKSSPSLVAFNTQYVMDQLATQTNFELTRQVKLEGSKLHVPKTLKWYANDFGTKRQIVEFIARNSHDELKNKVLDNLQNIDLKYNDFDWALNKKVT